MIAAARGKTNSGLSGPEMNAGWRSSLIGKVLLRAGSTWVGVALLAVLAVYMSLASTVPKRLAAALGVVLFSPGESVHVELYGYPLFVAACIALCVNLTVATIVRVPPRWRSLGAWCSHLGVIVLAGGSFWYNYRSVSGDSVTVRVHGGWSPIRHVYHKRKRAAYVQDARAAAAVETPLGLLNPRGGPRELDVPLAGGGDGVSIRATRFIPLARIAARWADVSPNRIPAVQLRVTDGDEAHAVVLSPSLPEHRQFGGRGYAMIYHARMSKEALAKMIAPAEADRGPGMPYDVAMILTGEDVEPTLAVVRPDGSRWHGRLQVGKPLDVPLAGRTVRVEAVRFFEHAARLYELARDGREAVHPPGPALRVDVTAGAWKRTTYVPFAAYQHLAAPQLIDLPGNRGIWLSFSRERIALPATLRVKRAEYQTYPASGIPKDYRCDVEIVSGGVRRAETLSLNHPVQVGPFQLSQGSWMADPHDPRQIFLIAATRPGLWAIWTGCVLICLGLPVAFYVKPLLMRGRPPT